MWFFFARERCQSILQQHDSLFKKSAEDSEKGEGEAMASKFQKELQEDRDEITNQYGWFFLAKEIADFCNDTYKNVLDYSATDVLSITMIIQAKIKLIMKQTG